MKRAAPSSPAAAAAATALVRPMVLMVVVVVFAVAAAAPRALAAGGDLLAHGTDERFWHAEVVRSADPAAPATERTVIRLRGRGDADRWQTVAELSGRAVALTDRRSELVVLLKGGAWVLVGEPDARGLSDVRSGDPLPDAGRIIALAGGGDVLWALGTAPALSDVESDTAAPATITTAAAGSSGSTTRPRAATGPAPPPDQLALFRLERGEWQLVRRLGRDLIPTNADPADVSLVLVDGRPWVASRVGNDRAINVHALSPDAEPEPRGQVATSDARPAAFKLLVLDGRPVLWSAGDTGAGAIASRGAVAADDWSAAVELKPSESLAPGTDRAVTTAARRFRLLALPGDRKLVEQPFGLDGAPLGAATQVTVLPTTARPDPRVHQFIQLVVLLLLTFILFGTFRRRGPLQEAMRKADRGSLAPLGARFVAGFVDAIPILAVSGYTIAMAAIRNETPAEVQARLWAPQTQMWYAVCIAVYLLHTTVSELLLGRTLGKWLLGLSVTTLDGGRPAPRAVLARNLLRIIDVILPLLLLMIAFSPLRQRLGDVAAGTLVVSDRARRETKPGAARAAAVDADADDS